MLTIPKTNKTQIKMKVTQPNFLTTSDLSKHKNISKYKDKKSILTLLVLPDAIYSVNHAYNQKKLMWNFL
jgi:hypothetical protein